MALSSLSHATPLKTHGFSFKYPFDSSPSLIASFSPKPNPTSSCIIPSHNNLLGKIILDSLKWRTGVSFLSGFPTKGEDINSLKEELYNTIAPLDRGAEATLQDQERVEEIARKLEALNEIKEPLKSSLLNGKWELIYTTSQSVLQTQRPKFLRPNGKIYQAINADTLRAQNIETWPFFNQVTANLVPLNSRRVAVKFDFFRIASLRPSHLAAGIVHCCQVEETDLMRAYTYLFPPLFSNVLTDTYKKSWKRPRSVRNYILG
ncbi:probable plastid-lipid-associated protein 4, chloroplastic isoform X1 [Malus sylvestris]|uniref:probable plastid-lipid-associated protein 4, chloroplastic isoform X1 n=1 Tax=Malus sylvestris TaxID=3752 RepID=UPI0021AD1607|nr:probable plastid-lipid-associated protein 4, chloroplastic isoform X1 [Malus sylvestris]